MTFLSSFVEILEISVFFDIHLYLHRIFLFGLKIFVEDILGPESSPKISSVAPGKIHNT